jgi:hypothetical protein
MADGDAAGVDVLTNDFISAIMLVLAIGLI